MIKNKWILVGNGVFLCFILLLVAVRPCLADEPKFSNISLEGRQLSSDYRFIEVKGHKFINLPFLRVFFHIATSWNQANNELYFKFGSYDFKLYTSKTTYTVNGTSRKLAATPFEKNGELWIPLEFFIRLGLKVKEPSKPGLLSLEWQANYILGFENITYRERPAFLIVGAKELKLTQYSLHEPERMVFQLAGTKLHFTMPAALSSLNPLVKRVRIKNERDSISYLVFELIHSSSCRVISDPKEPNQVIVVFNYLINDVQLTTSETGPKVRIKSSYPADYKVQALPESNRLLLKFNGATVTSGTKNLNGDNQKFRFIQVSQDDPNTVSVLLEMLDQKIPFVTRSHRDPTLLEIKDPSLVKEVSFAKTDNGSAVTISSDRELTENIRLLAPIKRLQIDLENAQFDTGLCQSLPVSNPIESINLVTVTANLARVEVNLNNLVAYDVHISDDRHKITVLIKNSTLSGKTIILDPGHGGVDTGACGKQNTREKDINLETALKLKTMLEQAGANVILTRNNDVFISLYERCYFANYQKADLFISIHTNSHPDPNVRGIEVFHYNGLENSRKLAQKVLKRITKSTGLKPLGVKTARFVVIRETQMPSILVELGFISNYQEETILKSSDFKEKAALGIFQGLLDLH